MWGLFWTICLGLAISCLGDFSKVFLEELYRTTGYWNETEEEKRKKEKKVMDQHKIIKKWTNLAGVIIFVLIVVCISVYNLGEHEQAVITTFGKASLVTSKGLNFKIPFLQKVKKVDTTLKGFSMGYTEEENESIEDESLMITSDYNFINVDFYIEYNVIDPIKYLYSSEDPISILKLIAQSSIRDTVGSYKIDEVLTTGKVEIQNKIKQSIMSKIEERDIGIALNNITMQDSEPPTAEVKAAFERVESARQGMDEALNNAKKTENEKIPEAKAKADEIRKNAESQKALRINEAKKSVEVFNAVYTEYIKNPDVTKKRMFYESMEEILPNLKIIIGDGTNTVLPLEKFADVQK